MKMPLARISLGSLTHPPLGRSEVEARALTQSQPRETFPSSGLQALTQEPLQVPFVVGDVVAGKYEVTGLLGSGGMGYVISARHVELGEMVALKFLRPEALPHPELVERFAREARAAAKIRSEHIANVFDVGTQPDGTPYIVMEYLAGKDLADHLHQEGPLPIDVAVEYIMQACEALAAAHAHGIVHRDIKPENLFLTQQAQGMHMIKVLDFGISKVALPRGKRDLVRTQMALGSPVYMSPEQIRRSDQVDARSDIWAVGCVLFELLTGVTAFDEPSLLELSAAILERDPVPLTALRPDANEELEAVVVRCLSKNPDERYQNVADLAIALYPFAPRRARISVERCYHILKNAGVVSTELDLASAYPPPISGRVTSGAFPINSKRTTSPATVEVTPEPSAPARKAAGSNRLLIVAGLGIAAAAGAWFAWNAAKSSSATGRSAAVAPTKGAELPSNVSAPAAVTGRVIDLDQDSPSSPSASQPSSSAQRGSKSARAPRAVRVAPIATGKRPRAGEDELDPGF
jgi:eukaryotic-like serine/threonine-protein kinase